MRLVDTQLTLFIQTARDAIFHRPMDEVTDQHRLAAVRLDAAVEALCGKSEPTPKERKAIELQKNPHGVAKAGDSR